MHAFSHITGGGLANNLARVLPGHLTATVDRATWSPAPIFGLVGEVGGVAREDLEATLNMGVGMVAIVAAPDADRAVPLLADRGVPAWVAGHGHRSGAEPRGQVTLVGAQPLRSLDAGQRSFAAQSSSSSRSVGRWSRSALELPPDSSRCKASRSGPASCT